MASRGGCEWGRPPTHLDEFLVEGAARVVDKGGAARGGVGRSGAIKLTTPLGRLALQRAQALLLLLLLRRGAILLHGGGLRGGADRGRLRRLAAGGRRQAAGGRRLAAGGRRRVAAAAQAACVQCMHVV